MLIYDDDYNLREGDLQIFEDVLYAKSVKGKPFFLKHKIFYAYLLSKADENNQVSVSIRQLQKDLGAGSRNTVESTMKTLQERDLISIDKTKGLTSIYTIHPLSSVKTPEDPSCFVYVQELFKANKPYAIKFGQSINPEQRVEELSEFSRYTHSLIYKTELPNKKLALEIEDAIKAKFGGSFCTKEEMPQGFTETLTAALKEEVIEFIQAQAEEQYQ